MSPRQPARSGMIRRARPDEADTLSALAFRSKAHWGYDPVFMAACRDALTLTAGFIAAGEVYVMEVAGSALGFYSLTPWNSDLELFHFFIDPGAMGNGVGRRLWEDAIERAAGLGYSRILIQSDPYAEGFYLKLGAERIGEVPSAVQAGRVLPLLLFPLADGGPQEGGKR